MSKKKLTKLDMYAAAKELGIDWDELIKRVRADPPSSKELLKVLNSRAYRRRMKNISRGSVTLGDLVKGENSLPTKISNMIFTSSYWHLLFFPLSGLVPPKARLADAILLFVCKPDDAEVAAGDLFEELEKVNSRHGKWYCNFWFLWELSLLVIVKGRKRLTKSVLGPIADLWKRKSG